ncbi:MAG: phage tail tape measure protein, partial [Candidatus Peribacteraceae bacterium]|nr:phage tail tape measure protein [Candidatus Peribacteraceae bacterium]
QRTLRPETQKELARVGLSTTDLQGNFKGFIPVITELADRWDTLTRSQRLSIAQALGGARQYNVFLALMGNFDTAVKASTEAVNSQGSAQRENTKYMQTAAASMKKAKAAVDAMYVSMGSTLLPVVKTLSESVVGLAKAFQGIPNWAKAATASMLVFAVAGTRVASSLDYVMMSGGATTAGAGIGSVVAGGILGRGKTPEQLAALPIEKQAALRPAGRIGKGITDMGYVGIGAGGIGRGTSEIGSKLTAQGHQLRKLDTSWAAVNSGVQKGLKGSATWVDHNTTKMSKLNAVVRGYGVQAAGSTSTAALGMQALNSPISLAIALFANLTKGIAIFGIKLVAFLPGLIASMTGLGKATLATGKAFAVAQIRALGLFGTVALAAALGTAIYLIYDALSDVGKASHKTHGQIAKDFESQIAKGQKSLRQSSAELASLKRIESQRRKMIKLNEMSSEKKRAGIEQGVYKSALINALKFDELQQKAGASVAKVDPAAIESIDKYGRVILDTSKSMISLANASVAAQAQLVAFYKTKVAVAAAVETNTAFKNLEKAVKDYSDVLPLLKSRSNIFGQFAGYSEEIDKLGTSLIKAQHDFTVIMKVLQDTLGGLPPSTPIESFVSALGNTKILKAFASEAERVNTVLKEQGQAAGTAGDLMNKLFLKSKGFKNVGITGQVTAESFHSHRLLGRSIEQIDRELKEGKQVLKGKELITFGPEGPFGLTQARLFIDDAGKYMVQGINKAGVSITRTLSEVSQLVGKDSGALVFDPTVLVQQFNTSIAKARKILGGAGAGLIKFPAQLDLGVKFKFQLGNLEYLQSAGTDIADMITRVAVAQQAYGKTLGEFEKSAKQNPTGKRASDQLNNLNDTARMIAQSTFFVTLASEISNLGKAAEKAAYEMSTANLQDAVSQQFAALTTSAKGFSADLVFKLPKLGSQLSSVEKVTQSNPDIARSIKASDRALAVVEAQAKSFASTLQVDIPKIFEESGPSDLKRFFDKADQDRKSTAKNLRRYGDDKKAAAFGQDIQKVESAVLTQTKVLGEKLDTLAGKGKSDKREVITKLKFDPSIIDKFTRGIAERGRREDIGPFFRRMEDTAKKIRIEQAEEVRKRAKKNLGRATKDKTGRVDVSNVSTKKLYIEAAELARSQGKDFSYEQGRQIKERTVKGQQYALAQAVKSALVDTREEDKSTRGIIAKGFGIFSSDIGRAFEKEWWTPFRRSLPSIDTLGIAGSEYGTKERISTTANKKLISGLASNLSALRDTPVSEFQKIGQAFLDKQIKSYVKPGGKSITSEEDIARSNKSILSALSNYRPAMKALIDTTWKELKVQNEALKAITLVAVANKDFASSLTKSLKGIISFGKQLKALGSLTAPLVGAGAGIPKGRIDIGKSHGELGAYERLYKKFPGFVGSLTRQEQLRQKTLSELPGIYQKMEVSQQKLKEVSQYVTNPTQRTNLTRLGALSDTMFSQLANSVKNMNTQLRPLIKSFAEMQRLEQISKNIEDIVKALKKAEDLDFDTASIDKALGRHPLSPTAGVFGQPAGLNKFERERFVLDQKRRAGTIGGGAYGLERKKIDFGREEALIQYKQSKENTKLSQEVDAAKRAMGLLWDAQYQGIGGLQPMIDTIKSELSTAGDVTDIGGKREFQGIPSLQGLQKEIAKVQQQKRALNYRQQRDIVMGETERLLSKIHDLMKEQTKAVAQAEKDITGAEGVGGIEARIKAFNTALSSTTKALLSMLSAVQKPTGTAGAGAEAGRLAILNTKFADTMKAAGDSFKLGTDDYKKAVQDFVKAAANLSRSTESRATRHKGEKVLATTDKGPTGFATGGYIKGSPGLDTIDTNLPVGGFVMSRPAVQKHGLSKLNRMQSAVSSGNFSSSSIPAKVTTGEFVFGPQAVNSIGVGGLTSLNRGAGDGSGRFGKGGSVGTGRFNKNLLLDTFSSTDEKKSDINIRDKRVRNVMTLE